MASFGRMNQLLKSMGWKFSVGFTSSVRRLKPSTRTAMMRPLLLRSVSSSFLSISLEIFQKVLTKNLKCRTIMAYYD